MPIWRCNRSAPYDPIGCSIALLRFRTSRRFMCGAKINCCNGVSTKIGTATVSVNSLEVCCFNGCWLKLTWILWLVLKNSASFGRCNCNRQISAKCTEDGEASLRRWAIRSSCNTKFRASWLSADGSEIFYDDEMSGNATLMAADRVKVLRFLGSLKLTVAAPKFRNAAPKKFCSWDVLTGSGGSWIENFFYVIGHFHMWNLLAAVLIWRNGNRWWRFPFSYRMMVDSNTLWFENTHILQ